MIPVAGYFAFYIPSVQQYVNQKITRTLSAQFGTQVEINEIHYRLFRRAHFAGFLIRDPQGDTLIYARSVDGQVNLKLSSLAGKAYVFDRIKVDGALIRFITPPHGEPNYRSFFQSFQKETTQQFWPYIGFRSLTLTDTRFILQTGKKSTGSKVNFRDLEFLNLSAEIRNLEVFKQQTRMRIRNLTFRDRSGWTVNQLNANFEMTPEHLYLNRISVSMPFSNLHMDHLHFLYDKPADFSAFTRKIKLDIDIRQSALGYRDLSWFLTNPASIRNNIFISGKVSGRISDLQVKHLRILSGFESEFLGNIEAIGLPDIQNSYLYIDVNRLKSSIRDLQTFYRPDTHQQLRMPENFNAFGHLAYQGNFTGFLSDFVSYGTLKTDIGNFSGDISFKSDSLDQVIFQGQLNTYRLDIGKILKKDHLAGQMTMNMHVDGRTFPGNRFRTNLKGIIDSVELNRYMFHKVDVDGLFTEKAYDGSIRIDDPNLRLDFAGLVDFTQKIPEFDFSLNIPRANLFPLHFEKEDSAAFFSGLLLANFTGSGIDSLNGRINLLDAHIKRKNRQLEVFDIILEATADSAGKTLNLRSAYARGSLTGNYNFSSLPGSFRSMMATYFPETFPSQGIPVPVNDFTFQLSLINPEPFRFFIPKLDFPENIEITGRFNPMINLARISFRAPRISWSNAGADSILLEASAGNKNLSVTLNSKSFTYKKLISVDDMQTDIFCARDSVFTYLTWLSGDSKTKRSFLNIRAGLENIPGTTKPHITVTNDSGRVWLNDAWWALNRGLMEKDTSSFRIKDFTLSQGSRLFTLNGIYSDLPGDTLTAIFRDLDLSSLSNRNRNGQLTIRGILGGSLQMTGGKRNPLFFSRINISGLKLNGESLGNTRLVSRWDTLNHAMVFNSSSQLGNRIPITARGSYIPALRQLTADLTMDKINLRMFAPFTDVVFHDLTGILSGNIHAKGQLSHPDLSGQLTFQKTAFTIAYINTHYSFSADIPLKNNRFDLSGITVFDTKGHSALSSGYFSIAELKKPFIDLHLEANNMQALNIREQDNDIFYGTAYGTGLVSIKGPLKDITLNISASTGNNTRIYLPLGKEQNINTFDFIQFVSHNSTGVHKNVKSTTTEKQQGLNMNLDIKVTPDAEVSLIFNPATGEVLRSRGHGDLQLTVKKEGGFSMYGEYIEDEGDYLFALQNIISKRFRLANGGKITFNGDPLDADLDILAVYPVKTSLYQLLYDENYQRRIPVECQIKLTGKLQKPNIGFDIYLPTADENTRTKVQNAITSQEELSKQFLSLLIINSFYPDPTYGQPGILNTAGTIGITTTEVLSNQLSNWLSQISNDFDIGFSYHPGDEVTSDQVEVALSTQLLNDRVSINGNVDFKGQQANPSTSNIVGDFQIDVKLTDNGKLRVKAFTRANDKFIYEAAPYTNGIGIFYREEFNSWNELMEHYWTRIITKSKAR
ncbi:MAG: hypothetical protein GXO83_04235 [Chlorobi bacterium]|nr:hypothetical protein [Chlorobiota bacterium]